MLAGITVTTATLALIAGSTAVARRWPDAVDMAALAVFAGVAFGLPLFGYWLMAIDIRAYLRSLRRALVVIARAAAPGRPYWTWRGEPPCLVALELTMSCTEEEVLAAYRKRVKDLHPDRGGDLQAFLKLQRHFEQALHLARQRTTQQPQ